MLQYLSEDVPLPVTFYIPLTHFTVSLLYASTTIRSVAHVTIVEMGFMTNESDDLKMSDPDFQDTMASGIADGIDAYFAEK